MLVQACLRVGVAQIVFLNVPSYAAIDETVETLRMPHPEITTNIPKPIISFVNAMLRNIDKCDTNELLNTKTSIYDNISPWLKNEFITSYGNDKTKLIVEYAMQIPPIFISVNKLSFPPTDDNNDKDENEDVNLTNDDNNINNNDDDDGTSYVVHKDYLTFVSNEFNSAAANNKDDNDNGDGDGEAKILPHGSIRVPSRMYGSVTNWPLYNEGDWWVQDAAAAIPAIALYKELIKKRRNNNNDSDNDSNLDTISNMNVVDLCSAPGGKTAQLCSFGFGSVTAVEKSPKRIKPLKENLQRLGMVDQVEVIVADGTEWIPPSKNDGGRIDGVLVDAPCSATGTGSRRPDVLRKSRDGVDELVQTQRELVVNTVDNLLAPGGIMVYATCSLLQCESEDQMKWLLNRKEGAEMENIPFVPGEIPGFDDAIDENGWIRVIPGTLPGSLSQCDGFFVAKLRRRI